MKVLYTDLNKEDHAHIHDTMYRALVCDIDAMTHNEKLSV